MLQSLLAEGRPLLADGATGTNLFAMGLTSGDSPELWNAEHADRIESLHRAFVDAGSDIILTNSFGANRRRLMLHKLEGRTRELNRLAAGIARKVADKAGRPVVVAGSVGPTGDLLAPLGPLSEDEAVEIFIEQIEGLREGGADVAWIETMSAPEEMRAAARCGGQVRHALHAHRELRHRRPHDDGPSPAAFSDFVQALDPAPVAFGANCGVGASDLLAAILGMAPGAPLIAKANAGVPQWHGAEIHYSGTPELMETYAALAADCGARIVGGCCGNTPAHVAAMRRGLDARKPGARPDVESDRRGARSPRRAARSGDRRQPAAPAGACVNAKAKQRAQSRQTGPVESDPEAAPVQSAPLAPLTAPEGLQVFDVDAENAGERLDRFLGQAAAARRIALSRTRLKALIEAGEVRVDDSIARDPSTRLAAGARIAFEAPPAEESSIVGEDIELAVVYEDEHLIVIDKPAGLVVHPAPGHAAGTLVNALIRHCGASLSGIGGVKRPGIVHRLDKDTSGLLVVAKTDAAHQGLADLFADHGRTGSLEARISGDRLGRLRSECGQGRGRDRPRSAPSGENGGHERGEGTPRHDPLAGRGSTSARRASSHASSRQGGPTRFGSTWPRSVIRC